jgi:hypothetical protein
MPLCRCGFSALRPYVRLVFHSSVPGELSAGLSIVALAKLEALVIEDTGVVGDTAI